MTPNGVILFNNIMVVFSFFLIFLLFSYFLTLIYLTTSNVSCMTATAGRMIVRLAHMIASQKLALSGYFFQSTNKICYFTKFIDFSLILRMKSRISWALFFVLCDIVNILVKSLWFFTILGLKFGVAGVYFGFIDICSWFLSKEKRQPKLAVFLCYILKLIKQVQQLQVVHCRHDEEQFWLLLYIHLLFLFLLLFEHI